MNRYDWIPILNGFVMGTIIYQVGHFVMYGEVAETFALMLGISLIMMIVSSHLTFKLKMAYLKLKAGVSE